MTSKQDTLFRNDVPSILGMSMNKKFVLDGAERFSRRLRHLFHVGVGSQEVLPMFVSLESMRTVPLLACGERSWRFLQGE